MFRSTFIRIIPPCGDAKLQGESFSRPPARIKVSRGIALAWGVRHGLQLTERGSRLIGGNPFTLLTQVPKGARDGASQEAHPQGGRITPLRRGGRQKPGREALRSPRTRLGHEAHRDRRRPPRNPRSPYREDARPDPRAAGRGRRPAPPAVSQLPGVSPTAAL